MNPARILVMGVAGGGKSTLAEPLATTVTSPQTT